MPKKDGKTYCLNHPDQEMVILNEDNPDTFHALRLATWIYGKRLKMENKSTGFDIHALSLIQISEPTRLLSISYAVFCLKKKNNT